MIHSTRIVIEQESKSTLPEMTRWFVEERCEQGICYKLNNPLINWTKGERISYNWNNLLTKWTSERWNCLDLNDFTNKTGRNLLGTKWFTDSLNKWRINLLELKWTIEEWIYLEQKDSVNHLKRNEWFFFLLSFPNESSTRAMSLLFISIVIKYFLYAFIEENQHLPLCLHYKWV